MAIENRQSIENPRDGFDIARLVGLPGRSGDVDAVIVRSVDQAVEWLLVGEAVSAAGETGGLHVYADDHGAWRCTLMRLRVTLDSVIVEDLEAVEEWLRESWGQLGRED